MKYELDFIGIEEHSKDADAICFRYYDNILKRYVVVVYDGGLQKYGEALTEHLKKYYFQGESNPTIDYVICSHPDQDHASGLTEILHNFSVKKLIMNRPWLYIDELYKISDKKIIPKTLEDRLKEDYPYIKALEDIANEKNIKIEEGFQGNKITSNLTILSPSKNFYLRQILESHKTPLNSKFKSIKESICSLIESWTNELLREDVNTSPENESSIIVLGDMESEKFLLTGDAGLLALNAAADYAESYIHDLKAVKFYQIPHHGGRHNVSTKLLNRIVGETKPKNCTFDKTAFVSVAANSDHPRKMVTNAFIRRGVKVYETRNKTLCHHSIDMPTRAGWINANNLVFSDKVENWE